MTRKTMSALAALVATSACSRPALTPSETTSPAPAAAHASYFDQAGRKDVLSGGVRMIPVNTPKGTFRVWTKRTGNNPTVRVLLLHGGPGATHAYFEAFDSFFPGASIEYYFYDQLGSGNSDAPDDPSLLDVNRFVDEVEQVRQALNLDRSNFYLLGHSWGGLLAIEYALAHQDQLRALIVSNMMSSVPAYNTYAKTVLMPAMDQKVLAEILSMEKAGKTESPRYMELLTPNYYEQHILRMPAAEWPEPVVRSFAHINRKVYVPMQGPSEMGAAGLLVNWDRTADLPKIKVPTLVVAGAHDTMDRAYMERMAKSLPLGRYLLCPNGGHMALYDDQQTYMDGVIAFLRDVDSGAFRKD